jgi:hypothetical protein
MGSSEGETYRDYEPEVKRGLLGLETVEDVGGVVRELVQRHPDLLLCTLHRDVHARHPPGWPAAERATGDADHRSTGKRRAVDCRRGARGDADHWNSGRLQV